MQGFTHSSQIPPTHTGLPAPSTSPKASLLPKGLCWNSRDRHDSLQHFPAPTATPALAAATVTRACPLGPPEPAVSPGVFSSQQCPLEPPSRWPSLTCVTRGCSSAAEPLPTQRTAKRRQRQHRSTIRLSALCLFRVSDSTGQIWAPTGGRVTPHPGTPHTPSQSPGHPDPSVGWRMQEKSFLEETRVVYPVQCSVANGTRAGKSNTRDIPRARAPSRGLNPQISPSTAQSHLPGGTGGYSRAPLRCNSRQTHGSTGSQGLGLHTTPQVPSYLETPTPQPPTRTLSSNPSPLPRTS